MELLLARATPLANLYRGQMSRVAHSIWARTTRNEEGRDTLMIFASTSRSWVETAHGTFWGGGRVATAYDISGIAYEGVDGPIE
ncbi:hypothetical protein M427DRAFT_334753 [Gonapodya prolifera JEL478]|uniref:Uncharacterized protein n=1 Tax=Gonapodya prolifera (strain JEL478) TaxID=1344416 RepID=A0A139ADF9_GONPJ|nr:hypothetical protein M427DRAFT_334753 [Gonapodya prolifera JEL478]|eukprot:KXS14807.1 hypothetical protein M427DRAFT_334753 [Gonapodya prolifera JEL478]